MRYLENNMSQRFDPRMLVPETQTIVSLAISYNPGPLPTQRGIAWYAQGTDYHLVVRERLKRLMVSLKLTGRYFTDTAPVMEKYWAWRSGVGFIGRNTQLVIPHLGSTFFLGELFVCETSDHYDVTITPSFFNNLCGTCHRCEETCPTKAITESTMDSAKCLSYLTIEHKGVLPEWAKPHLRECFYGCDRCLRTCPHLHTTDTPPIAEFQAGEQLLTMSSDDWQRLSHSKYLQLFRNSAVRRAKYQGLVRNILCGQETR